MPLMLAALVFVGCSSKSSDTAVAPSAAKSQVTTGVITGFGSVFVNGIEFSQKADVTAAQAVTFAFDDTQHAQTDLKIGMIVTVKGTADATTKKGEFESIEFKPELRGPADDVVVTSNTLKVMGHDVVTGATTSFEGVADLTALKAKIGATHPEVEISGRMDSAGVFHATRIAVKADAFAAGGKCAIHGKLATDATSTTGGKQFKMGAIDVVTTSTTSMPNLTTADLVAGASVEVKGTLDGNTLTATRIEGNKGHHGLGEGVETNDTVSIQGIASGSVSGGSFTMDGPNGPVTVNVTAATDMGGAAQSSIAANATLEVEGTVQADGSVTALKIKSETEIESESHSGGGGEVGGGGGGGETNSGK
jgi:hypothetical protein